MSTTDEKTPDPNQYIADANAKIAVLRTMAADFALPEPRALTAAERRLITATSREFVEKAEHFGKVATGISDASDADFVAMRDGEAYASAYDGFITELESLRQLAKKSVALRRLKSTRSARSIYRVAKSYVLTDAGDHAKPHVQEMKKALGLRRRRSADAQSQTPETPTPGSPIPEKPAKK
jgi:hypothetical protein